LQIIGVPANGEIVTLHLEGEKSGSTTSVRAWRIKRWEGSDRDHVLGAASWTLEHNAKVRKGDGVGSMAGAGDHQWCALAPNTPPLAPPLITPNPVCRAFLRRNGAILPFVNIVRCGENFVHLARATKDVLNAAGKVFNAIFKGVLYRLVGAMSCSHVGVAMGG
jgi:hypothetical protein